MGDLEVVLLVTAGVQPHEAELLAERMLRYPLGTLADFHSTVVVTLPDYHNKHLPSFAKEQGRPQN